MTIPSREALRRLGSGSKIRDICAEAGWSRAEFDAWWRSECRRRVPPVSGRIKASGLQSSARIERDRRGLPHVFADHDADLFFGLGYAAAADRLFQLDYLRRKATGRLAEVLGPEAVESDQLSRTIGLHLIAEREWDALPAEPRELLARYSDGINALIAASGDRAPIEFDLLEYRPEPWRPQDSLAILCDFRAYLTIRFPVLLIPELVKQALGDGSLYRDYIIGEADEESVLVAGEYAPSAGGLRETFGESGGDDGGGSNNWVLAGARTTSKMPILASDPHVPFHAVSIWYEARLCGGSFHVAGVTLAGTPGIMIGRNERVAWGITNNLCSQRDLYFERSDSQHPGCYLFDGKWERARERQETIRVRGEPDVVKTIRMSRHGPIVDEVLPAPARHLGPISLRWLGAEPCGWLTALINSNRAGTAAAFRESLRPWLCPTFNVVFADVDGRTGFHSAGRLPIRKVPERGVRPGWDPNHEWTGIVPFEEMPSLLDPPRNYVATANNRTAPSDFPQLLSGVWSAGWRARRVREWIEAHPRHSPDDSKRFQQDVVSLRAQTALPQILRQMADESEPEIRAAIDVLQRWDCRIAGDSAGAAIFNVFFTFWCKTVCAARFAEPTAGFLTPLAGGIALRLLADDRHRWFADRDRREAIRETMRQTVSELSAKLGADPATWLWGRLHALKQSHFLSARGDLGSLLDRSGLPVGGDGVTVNSATPDANYHAWLGAGYRMVADLADPDAGIWSVEVGSASGHPGSPHYDDQLTAWIQGEYYHVSLRQRHVNPESLVLEPG